MNTTRWTALLGLSTFACATPRAAAPATPADPATEVRAIADDYWNALMERNPTWATYLGDYRYNDRLEDLSDEGRAAWRERIEGFRRRLRGVDPEPLAEEDRITLELLRRSFDRELESMLYRTWTYEVDQMGGPQVRFLEIVNTHPLDTPEHIADLAKRYEAFGAYMDQYLANLRDGMRSDRTAWRGAVERVVRQTRAIPQTPPERSPLVDVEAVRNAAPELRDRLVAAVRDVIYPAYTRMADFLEQEYLPVARETPGISTIRDGRAAYAFCVRDHTTLDLTPQQIHQIGREELARLRTQMEEIARAAGHTGDLRSFLDAMRDDPANYYGTRQELLDGFRAILRRIDERLPQLFLRVPQTPYEVLEIEGYREADAPAAYYYGPPDDGSRAGRFYVNAYRPETRPKYNMVALASHEAVPGHHFQIAFAIEQKSLPRVRRHGGFTSFVEGWALYAETLTDELGLYDEGLTRMGMLAEQAWRACRLVVDTGIHEMGWTREQAITFMMENVPLSQLEVENEIDRYIIWPGQALAYMIGRMEFQSLRARAAEELGDAFDVREFHDVVLRHGALPLTVLRGVVDRWIAAKKQGLGVSWDPIRIERTFAAPRERLFQAFANPEDLNRWLTTECRIEPRAGGAYELFWNPQDHAVDSTLGCRIVDWEPPSRLGFLWRGPAVYRDIMDVPGSTWVRVSFEEADAGTRVVLVHDGWGRGARWGEARAWFVRNWTEAFARLEGLVRP